MAEVADALTAALQTAIIYARPELLRITAALRRRGVGWDSRGVHGRGLRRDRARPKSVT